MTVMNRHNLKKQLQLGLNTVFGLEYKRHPEQWRKIFTVESSSKAWEEDVLVVGPGGAAVKPEGRGVQYREAAESWSAKYQHETIAIAMAVTEEAVEDNLYMDVGRKSAVWMARALQHTKEIKGASVLNNGFTAGAYAMGDGVALFSTAHPLYYGGTGSNTLSTQADLSEAALEDALILISTMVDDAGMPISIMAKDLIVPPQLNFVADRLLNSAGRTGTSDNDINSIRNQGLIPGGYSVNQRLTDSNGWFITTDCPDGAKHFVRRSVKGGMEGDFETGNLRFKKSERYSFGVSNWRGLVGSSGAS